MATIKVISASQENPEAPVAIRLGLQNWVGVPGPQGPQGERGPKGETGTRGPKGDTPVKGVDYFTQEDIDNIVEIIEADDIVETDPTVPEWAKQQNKPTYTAVEVGALPANTVIPTVPTNVSAFTNDAGYLTSHQSLDNYATKSYVEQVVAGIETGALKRSVVQSLPVSNIDENTIYMVARSGASGTDIYDEYLRVNNAWEKIGSTQVDLTNYALKSELFSGSYNDLTDKPTIPAAYTLPTASTSTLGGVKVDGSTITIDNNGVISSTASGGGSSYTAGSGIDIDANNVISAYYDGLNFPAATMFNSGLVSNLTLGGTLYNKQCQTAADIAESLKKYKIAEIKKLSYSGLTPAAINTAGNTNYGFYKFTNFDATASTPTTSTYYDASSTSELSPANEVTCLIQMNSANIAVFTSLSAARSIFGFNLAKILQISPYGQTNYTRSRLDLVIDDLDNAISEKITAPTAPSTDGTYFLTTTVSSGVATQSWESVVIGGSY